MASTFVDALNFALNVKGWSVHSLAKRAGVPYDRLKQVTGGRTKSTNADDAYRLVRAFGVSFEDFIEGRLDSYAPVTLSGTAAQNGVVSWHDTDTADPANLDMVEAPRDLPPFGICAVSVDGDGMEPVYSDGDVLFYAEPGDDPVPPGVIDTRCIVQDADGARWIRQLRRGEAPGLFHLVGINPGSTTFWNAPVTWAARIRVHWPAEMVRRL